MTYCGYVYKITCLINNRCYVGQHRKSVFDEAYWGSSKNPEIRKKISEGTSKSQIGKHWFNNGFINVFKFECPEGFKPGRLYKRKKCIKDN